MKKIVVVLALILCFQSTVSVMAHDQTEAETEAQSISGWTEGSEVMESIISCVTSVTDRESEDYRPVEDRIAVFDFDGTLFGERFPTTFDTCLMLHRILHDETFEAPDEVKEAAKAMEDALYQHLPEPDQSLSTGKTSAESFQGMRIDEYRAYVRNFMEEPAFGFDGMEYGDAFFQPMTALVEYLADHGFKIFISSGSERSLVRELTDGTLDQWIPSENVIGSTFCLTASGQGDQEGNKYTYAADDAVVLEGTLTVKNQKTNKVFSIIDEIGKVPVLVFGNSSGDLAMGQYVVQHGGKGYMLLCDDTERDYGDLETAEEFARECEAIGLETVSMKNDFETIYGEDVEKNDATGLETEEDAFEEYDKAGEFSTETESLAA